MLAVTAPPESSAEQLTRAMRTLEAAFLLGVEGVTELWLVRHADAYDGLTVPGDPPLSARGREQARRLAERVRRVEVDAVYASPLARAQETAAAISPDVRTDARLVEMALVITEDGGIEFTEEPAAVAARMRAALADIVAAHEGRRVVVVSHAAAIIAVLTDILMLDPGRLRVLPYFTSVSIVRALGDRHMVGTFGDVSHLE